MPRVQILFEVPSRHRPAEDGSGKGNIGKSCFEPESAIETTLEQKLNDFDENRKTKLRQIRDPFTTFPSVKL
jgi:hypothetical protein